MYKQGNARGTDEVRRGTSSTHFHYPVPRSSSHIGHGKSRDLEHLDLEQIGVFPKTTLIFFSLRFWKTARKTTKKARISSACHTAKILGKEGKNAQNRKEFLAKEKGKENQKGKEKKIREAGKLIPRQLMCVIGTFTESTLWKRQITQNNSCQKALCNRCPV